MKSYTSNIRSFFEIIINLLKVMSNQIAQVSLAQINQQFSLPNSQFLQPGSQITQPNLRRKVLPKVDDPHVQQKIKAIEKQAQNNHTEGNIIDSGQPSFNNTLANFDHDAFKKTKNEGKLALQPRSTSENSPAKGSENKHEELVVPAGKKVVYLIIAFVLVGIIGLTLGIIYTHRCVIFKSSCEMLESQTALIVNRQLYPNQCFVVNYTKYTETIISGSSTIQRTNLTMYYCIKNITSQSNIQGVGYLKKISEEAIEPGTLTVKSVQLFDTQVALEAPLLLESVNSTEDLSSSENGTTISMTVLGASENITLDLSAINDATQNLVMFLFKIFRNGTLGQIIFDRTNDNLTIGQLPKLLKMFFPQLSLDLYTPSKSRRLKSQSSDSTNYTYQALNNGETILSNQYVQPPVENGGFYSSQKANSVSNFDNGGNLTSAQFSGTVEAQSPTTSSSEASVSQNLSTFLSINHKISMKVASTMFNLTTNNILSFEAFIQSKMIAGGNLLTMNEAQIINYMGDSSNKQNSSSRLLQNLAGGQILLFKDKKQVSLLKTSLVGYPLNVIGYSSIFIAFKKSGKYQYRPRFVSTAGLQIQIGPFKQDEKIFQFEKFFDPLSLGFTLEKVNQLISLAKGDFLRNVSSVSNLTSASTFFNTLGPQLTQIDKTISETIKQIDNYRQQLYPLSQITDMVNNVKNLASTFSTYISALITSNKDKFRNITQDFFRFTNNSLTLYLKDFQQAQTQFLNFNSTGSIILQNLIADSDSLLSTYASNILSLIKPQLVASYNQQIAKAQPFFDLYYYVRNNSKDLNSNFTTQVSILTEGFNAALTNFLNIFYLQPQKQFFYIKDQIQKKRVTSVGLINELNGHLRKILNDTEGMLERTLVKLANESPYLTNSQIQAMSSAADSLINSITKNNQEAINNILGNCSINGTAYSINQGLLSQKWRNNVLNINGMDSQILKLNQSTKNLVYLRYNLYSAVHRGISYLKSNYSSIQQKYSSIQWEISYISQTFQASFVQAKQIYETFLKNLQYKITTLQPTKICSYLSLNNCCQQALIQNAAKNLTQIKNQVLDYQKKYFQTMAAILGYINQFNSSIFPKFRQMFNLTSLTIIALTLEAQNNMTFEMLAQAYQYINTTKSNIIQSYKIGLPVKEAIASSFQYFRTYTVGFCSSNQAKLDQITKIWNDYSPIMAQIITFMDSTSFLNTSSAQLKAIISYFPNNYFSSVIFQMDYCSQDINMALANLTVFINDTVNFVLIQRYASTFWAQINQAVNVVSQANHIINIQDLSLYKLFDYSSFVGIIRPYQQLVDSYKQVAKNLGLSIFELKQLLPFLNKFKTVNQSLVDSAVSLFKLPSYNINYFSLFNEFDEKLQASNVAIQNLNFQVLQAYIVIKSQAELILFQKDLAINQTKSIIQDSKGLFAQFLFLSSAVDPMILIGLDDSFISIKKSIIEKILTPFLQRHQSYNALFNNLIDKVNAGSTLNFKDKNLEKIVVNSTKILINCTNKLYSLLTNYSNSYGGNIDQAYKLVKLIKIRPLYEVYLISTDFSKLIAEVQQIFASKLTQMQNLQKLILNDAFVSLGSRTLLETGLSYIKNLYTKRIDQLRNQISKHVQILQQDPVFYQQFLSTNLSQKITDFMTLLSTNFTSFNQDISMILDSISTFQKNLASSVGKQLAQLSYLKGNLTSVQGSIKHKLSIIKEGFINVDHFFNQLLYLVFIQLQDEINIIVIGNMKRIGSNISSIFKDDTPKLIQLLNGIAPNQFNTVRSSLSKVVDLSSQANPTATLIQGQITADINKVTNFINSALTKKFSSLKQAQNLLNTMTTSQKTKGNVVLYQKVSNNYVGSPLNAKTIVATSVGPFTFSVALNKNISCDIVISLVDTRSVDFAISFGTTLNVSLKFGYEYSGVRQYGEFVRGKLLNIKTWPGFKAKNMVPYQIIQELKWNQEIKNQNYLRVTQYADVEVYANSFIKGRYENICQFKRTWLKVQYCINVRISYRLLRSCKDLSVPIITSSWKYTQSGTQVSGAPIAKKRLWQLEAFKMQYA